MEIVWTLLLLFSYRPVAASRYKFWRYCKWRYSICFKDKLNKWRRTKDREIKVTQSTKILQNREI